MVNKLEEKKIFMLGLSWEQDYQDLFTSFDNLAFAGGGRKKIMNPAPVSREGVAGYEKVSTPFPSKD